jgi:hemolysin D
MWSEARPRRELEFLPAALELIETPVSPAGRWTMAAIGALIVTAVAWASIGRVDIIATATGRIIPAGKVKLVQPLEIGVVQAIHVAEGDHVAAGQVLVELDPTGNAADAAGARRAEIQAELDTARLTAQADPAGTATLVPPADAPLEMAALAASQLEAKRAEYREKLGMLDAQYAAKEAERVSALSVIAKLQSTLPLLRQNAGIYKKLLDQEYAPKIQYLDAARAVLEQEHDLDTARHQVDQAAADETALARQKTATTAEFRRETLDALADAGTKASEARSEYEKLSEKAGLQTLRAPVTGTVQQLQLHTIGGVVTPAEPLMVIVPSTGGLEIEATVNNRDVGFVAPGQPVDVKVEAFNFTRYGLLHGTVTGLSRDAVDPSQGSDRRPSSTPTQEPGYVAHIVLAKSGFETEQGWIALEPGMQVTADIKTGRRRVIDFLLSPLERYRNEAFHER